MFKLILYINLQSVSYNRSTFVGLSILWVIIVIGSVLYYFSPYISIGFQLKLVVVVVVD